MRLTLSDFETAIKLPAKAGFVTLVYSVGMAILSPLEMLIGVREVKEQRINKVLRMAMEIRERQHQEEIHWVQQHLARRALRRYRSKFKVPKHDWC
jgi:hypothetical protein